MNRIPQNDPGFLAFQRKLRSENRKRRLKRSLAIFLTLLSMLLLLAGGVFMIWHAGKEPAVPKDDSVAEPNTPSTQNGGQSGELTPDDPSTPIAPPESPNNPDDPVTPSDDPDDGKIIVYVDAGHGFGNSYGVPDKGAGAGTPYYELTGKYESDLNLDVALKLKEILLEQGFEVIMSRESESAEPVTVNERVAMVNQSGADIFVSVHANSSSAASAKGARVYYSTLNAAAAKCENYANAMAAALNATQGASLKTVTVNTDRSDVAVIKGVRIPTVLVETCFMTNEEDAALAATEEWVTAMATGICRGIQNYLTQTAA